MVNATIGVVGGVLVVIALGMMTWYGSFYGDSAFEDNFESVDKPTGLLSFLEFALDISIAVAKTFVDLITFDAHDLPDSVRTPLCIAFGLTFGLGIMALIISVVS